MLPPQDSDNQWEAAVQRMAVDMVYPPTPNIAGKVRQRLERRSTPAPILRLAQASLIVVLILAALLTVPQVRAEVLRILQIGAIRIIFDQPNLPTPTAAPDGSPTPLQSVLDLPDETTLATAREELDFEILLPTYPPDLGEPDRVFLIKSGTIAVALIWTDTADPNTPILSLFAFPPESNVWKYDMDIADEIRINGEFALWTDDPHQIEYWSGNRLIQRIVDGSVLIWFAEGITYRLEGAANLDEAVRIVESLQRP